jgi:hypothetical protein
MYKIIRIIIDTQEVEVTIRQAKPGDEIGLHELNQRWTKEFIGHDKSRGFLTSLYTCNEFRQIIDMREIVVAEVENKIIIGWCLVNNCIENRVLNFSREKVILFKNDSLIPMTSKVALALQWCVDGDYQGKGIIKYLFNGFCNLLDGRYDLVEASVLKQNPAGNKATQSLGMQTIFEDDERYYRITYIKNTTHIPPSLQNIN